jgi:hypothetical protein
VQSIVDEETFNRRLQVSLMRSGRSISKYLQSVLLQGASHDPGIDIMLRREILNVADRR